jgi:hypothetical protein
VAQSDDSTAAFKIGYGSDARDEGEKKKWLIPEKLDGEKQERSS